MSHGRVAIRMPSKKTNIAFIARTTSCLANMPMNIAAIHPNQKPNNENLIHNIHPAITPLIKTILFDIGYG